MSHRSKTTPAPTRWSSLVGHRAARLLVRRPARRQPTPLAISVSEAERRRAAELEQELRLARDIQQGLLLEAAPRLPGWEVAAVSAPARDLGGDLYDFLRLGDSLHGIMIGDVSGKGLPAALRMAVARTVFRHEARNGYHPAATLAAVNGAVLSEIPQGMVTMLYARLDTQSGLLELANAGHTFPMLVSGLPQELELSGLPLGVDADSSYEQAVAVLAHGDTLLLYTDGLIEAENGSGEIFSFERLQALVTAHRTLKPRALLATLLQELRSWSGGEQTDDVTIVLLRRRLARLADELHSITGEILGAERAIGFWAATSAIVGETASAEAWLAALPELGRLAQASFGRGLARELQQQLRLAIEDYRHPTTAIR
jgi:sigma-B regulation protein RsbU (phosphoserine phosphatase)